MKYVDPPTDPYSDSIQDFTPETQPLDLVIKNAIESAFLKKHVWMPAQVVNVRGNQKVDLQILLQGRYVDGQVVTRAPIQNVMVSMPMGADYSIKLPVAVGDTGIALFCDRSLDVWSVQGGIVDPEDTRNHNFSDAVFIPGLYPFTQQTTDKTTDLIIKNGNSQIRIQKDGKFQIKNDNQELIDLLDQLLDTLINKTFTLTILGPMPFIDFTNLLLQDIKTKLETLKGP